MTLGLSGCGHSTPTVGETVTKSYYAPKVQLRLVPKKRRTPWKQYDRSERNAYRVGYRTCNGYTDTNHSTGTQEFGHFLYVHRTVTKLHAAGIEGCLDGFTRHPLTGSGIKP